MYTTCIDAHPWLFLLFFFSKFFIQKFFNSKILLVLPYINMYLPQVYTCSLSWTPLPPPSSYHPSGSSQWKYVSIAQLFTHFSIVLTVTCNEGPCCQCGVWKWLCWRNSYWINGINYFNWALALKNLYKYALERECIW